MTDLDLAAILGTAWTEHLQRKRRGGRTPHDYVWASGSRDCVRQMALDLMHPEDAPEWTPDQLERFERGNEREDSVVSRLHHIGKIAEPPFKVVGGQERFEIHDRDGTLLIVGRIDGRIQFDNPRRAPIFEIKSGQSYANVETVDDLDRSPWTRRGADQLLAYAFAKNEPEVLLIVDRPALPLFLLLRLEDHLEKVERFLQYARQAIDARRGGPLPPFTDNQANCRRCDHFGKTCAPPVDFGKGLQVITDERVIQAAELVAKHREIARDVARAEKEVKEACRGIEQALVGPLIVNGKPGRKTWVELPDEIREKYSKTDPEGKWISSMEPHGVSD